MKKKNASFKLFGILGYPLGHSLSPRMQEAAFRKIGSSAFYVALEIAPEKFRKLLQTKKSFLLSGFNVTVPHKERILSFCDVIRPEAKAIGAVNTVFRSGKKWIGTNTDAYGFLTSLKLDGKFRPRNKKVLLLGAGGSARAVLYALLKEGAKEIFVANRTQARAQKLVRSFKKWDKKNVLKVVALKATSIKKVLRDVDLVVNSTSLGLKASDKSVLAAGWLPKAKPKRILFYDLIYKPERTKLLRLATARGHRVVNGSGMLVYQGAKSFEHWTGKKAPVAVMKKTLNEALN